MKHTPLVNVLLPTGIRRVRDMTITYERSDGAHSFGNVEMFRMQLLQAIDTRRDANLMLCQVEQEEKKKFVKLRVLGK